MRVLEDEHDALGPRYRLSGHKMWISAGEHEITENIIHLVLAKIPGPDGKLVAGHARHLAVHRAQAIWWMRSGRLTGERNDVALAGLNHKCGWRGTTNTLLNFGERGGAVGYLVGKPGEGLRCMFHMMNEARIGVGMAATMLGMAGYEASLAYAKQRPQGRPITGGGKDAAQPQVPIIEHADVKRMLLAQKAYAEGALALQLYCARLVDEQHSGDEANAREAAMLLDVLTPIAKSWPSEWCLEGNSLAIQVHGGYGYTRDFPVEQYWRDQRLNMIHEGTHGIQALDLLGRKVTMDGGAGLKLLAARISATIERAGHVAGLGDARPTPWRPRCSRSAPRPKPPGPPACPKKRWPMRRRTCKPSATRCWRGCGSTWRWRLSRATMIRRKDNAPRCAISSPTSCRRSAPGCLSYRRATRLAAR